MFNVSLVALGNKFLNLIVLVIACMYLVKKYLAPYIKKTLKEREEHLFALEQAAIVLRLDKAAIEKVTEEKRIYAQQLLAKVQIWKNIMEEREILLDQERNMIEKKSLEYLKKRADGLCHEYLKAEVIPHIFAQTKEQVTAFFKDQKVQKEYIATGLKALQKGHVRG